MRRLITALTVLAALALVPGVAGAQDLRSPDARDSGRQLATAGRDLRSPDARDVASRPVTTYTAGRIQTPGQPAAQVTDGGFSWGDAGIGAAGTLGLIALLAGTGLVISQRRRDRRVPITTS